MQHPCSLGRRRRSSVARAGERTAYSQELSSKLKLRAPYVAPLNVLQALAMASIREQQANGVRASMDVPSGMSPSGSRSLLSSGSLKALNQFNVYEDPETWALLNRDPETVPNKDLLMQAFKDTLIITIKGIAAGMQNTG